MMSDVPSAKARPSIIISILLSSPSTIIAMEQYYLSTVIVLLLVYPLVARPAFITSTSNKHHRFSSTTTTLQLWQGPPRSPRCTSLTSTTARDSSSQSSIPPDYNVIYQKVLRAPRSSSSSHTFLLDLISFLQSVYQVPNDLPVPYKVTVPDEEGEEFISPGNRAVLIIDSPLSSSPFAACIEVEVIGIFPDNSDVQTCPTMAMVALRKRKDPNNRSGSRVGNNGAVKGLFDASENQIVKSFDRAMQDFEEGRVFIPPTVTSDDEIFDNEIYDDEDGVDAAIKRVAYKNSIEAASASSERKSNGRDVPIVIERDGLGNIIIDSTASPVASPVKNNQKKVKESKISQPIDRTAKTIGQSSVENGLISASTQYEQQLEGYEDYAITMARQQAKALMTSVKVGSTTSSMQGTVAISGGESDFAIMIAKRVASRLQNNTPEKHDNSKTVEETSARNTSPTSSNVQKGKVQDLSNDATFLELCEIANQSKKTSWKRTISKTKSRDASSSFESVDATPTKINKSRPNSDPGKATRSLTADGEAGSNRRAARFEKTDDEIRTDVMNIAQTNERVQQQLKEATDMMQVEKEGEEGLSPEELLRQVLKFGDEKENEVKPGLGFVEGAFGKAKELLSNGNEYDPVKDDSVRDFADDDRKRAEEEELKRIFAVGQSVAESRMVLQTDSVPSILAKPPITDDDINELIDADDTVPRNARVLDDELAELEVRMSRTLQEGSNKLFDVFSGPEVYNPNVDPETAVNWPGAKEGTRTDVKLATDLSTALKQARFASAVLTEIREESGEEHEVRYFIGSKELPIERVDLLRKCVDEGVKAGLIEDPEILMIEHARLQMVIDELISQPEERLEEIAMNYKDLLLSDNLVDIMRERVRAMAQRDLDARREGNEESVAERHASERAIMKNLARIAQLLVKEAQALGAELEVSMLEIIRSICEVAMDPSHKTEEDTALALTDAVRDMRPLLDDAFVAYLKYAIAEEEGKLARAGVVDDPDHNRWLFVLKIVQEGVYAELSQGVKRYVDHIWYVLRMKSKSERKELLTKLIDVMPTMDVRPFVRVVNNIVSSLGTTVKGDFTDGVILGEMTNQLLQLQRDVGELLPPERINELSKDADAWAAAQRQKLLERRNLTRQRLEAARITGDIDPDKVIIQPGAEAERFD
ncbi:hypothetical protein ACHAXH_008232 [Discostella pseudostelligera]